MGSTVGVLEATRFLLPAGRGYSLPIEKLTEPGDFVPSQGSPVSCGVVLKQGRSFLEWNPANTYEKRGDDDRGWEHSRIGLKPLKLARLNFPKTDRTVRLDRGCPQSQSDGERW